MCNVYIIYIDPHGLDYFFVSKNMLNDGTSQLILYEIIAIELWHLLPVYDQLIFYVFPVPIDETKI